MEIILNYIVFFNVSIFYLIYVMFNKIKYKYIFFLVVIVLFGILFVCFRLNDGEKIEVEFFLLLLNLVEFKNYKVFFSREIL